MELHVGLATNDSHYSACSHLNHLGVFELFDEVIAADTVSTPKPSGDMIRQVRRHGRGEAFRDCHGGRQCP